MKLQLSFAVALLLPLGLRAQDMPLSQIVIPGEEWQKIKGEFKPITALTSWSGRLELFGEKGEFQGVLKDDGVLSKAYDTQYIFAFAPFNGFSYSVLPEKRLLRVRTDAGIGKPINEDAPKEKPIKEIKLPQVQPSGWAVTRDYGSLFLGDAAGKHIWMYRFDADGGLSGGEKYITLRVRKEDPRSLVSTIVLDNDNRIYAATSLGVQVFDPIGRLCGLLLNPSKHPLTAMTFGGEDGHTLYIACGTELYQRKLLAKKADYPGSKK